MSPPHEAKEDRSGDSRLVLPHSLHAALREGRNLEEIRAILEDRPDAIKEASSKMIPLHVALSEGSASPEVVQYLVSLWPESVLVQSPFSGNCALHFALRFPERTQVQVSVARALLQGPTGSRAAAIRDNTGNLAIHYVSKRFNVSQSSDGQKILRLLVQAFPESINERDASGWLPLELAYQRSNTIVESLCPKNRSLLSFLSVQPSSLFPYILSANPNLMDEETGDTTLHYACKLLRLTPSADSIRPLLRPVPSLLLITPGNTQIPNHSGALPFHIICQNVEAPECEILSVLQTYEAAATVSIQSSSEDPEQEWPLHLLLRHHPKKIKVLQKVVQLYPAAVETPDANKQLPLIVAAENSDLDIVFCILRCRPDLLGICNLQAFVERQEQLALVSETRQAKRQRTSDNRD